MTFKKNEIIWLSDQLKPVVNHEDLVRQINKDANLAGVDFELKKSITALEIANELNKIIANLIKNDFSGYLNFLYRIDVSEKNLIMIKDFEFHEMTKKVTILIIKKELQKIWIKYNFKNKIQ
jgi:hypothetical protein